MNNIEEDDSESSSSENDEIEDIPLAKKCSKTPSASSFASIESSKCFDVSKNTGNHGINHILTAPEKEIVASFSNSTNPTPINTVDISTEALVATVKPVVMSSKTQIAEQGTSSNVMPESTSNNDRDEFFSSFSGSTPIVSSTEMKPLTPTLGYTTKTANIEVPNSLTDSVAGIKPEELPEPLKFTSTITDSMTITVTSSTSGISTTITSPNITPNKDTNVSDEKSVISQNKDVTQFPPDPPISTASSSPPSDAGK
jgi:hypothetical protein